VKGDGAWRIFCQTWHELPAHEHEAHAGKSLHALVGRPHTDIHARRFEIERVTGQPADRIDQEDPTRRADDAPDLRHRVEQACRCLVMHQGNDLDVRIGTESVRDRIDRGPFCPCGGHIDDGDAGCVGHRCDAIPVDPVTHDQQLAPRADRRRDGGFERQRARTGQHDRGMLAAGRKGSTEAFPDRGDQGRELGLAVAEITAQQRITHTRRDVDGTRIQQNVLFRHRWLTVPRRRGSARSTRADRPIRARTVDRGDPV
jgi:hypothetical protein